MPTVRWIGLPANVIAITLMTPPTFPHLPACSKKLWQRKKSYLYNVMQIMLTTDKTHSCHTNPGVNICHWRHATRKCSCAFTYLVSLMSLITNYSSSSRDIRHRPTSRIAKAASAINLLPSLLIDVRGVSSQIALCSTGKLARFWVQPGHLHKQAETFRIGPMFRGYISDYCPESPNKSGRRFFQNGVFNRIHI